MIKAGQRPDATQFLENAPAAGSDLSARRDDSDHLSLTGLVRQWMAASEALERQARPDGDTSPLRPTWTPPDEDSPVTTVSLPQLPARALPRRRRQPVARPTRRLAVLIDVDATTAGAAAALFDLLADQGTVSVCRAYADWTSPEVRSWWSAPLREHAIQPYHHFGREQGQRSLVALTIDAVDLARESAVDVVVLVGDLAALHPLVLRLNASGVQVIGFGTTPTPRDVRDFCHEFVDLSEGLDPDHSGQHRG